MEKLIKNMRIRHKKEIRALQNSCIHSEVHLEPFYPGVGWFCSKCEKYLRKATKSELRCWIKEGGKQTW